MSGELLAAAAAGRRGLLELAIRTGESVPALAQRALQLAQEPEAVAQWPRECRIINERRAKRAAQGRLEMP